MKYYMLECYEDELYYHVTLEDVPEFEDVSWISGALIPIDAIPTPLKLAIEGEADDIVPPIIDEGIPLFRNDVIELLKLSGVNNLQLFDVEILDRRSGATVRDFKAVNVIGLVAAADLDASDCRVHGRPIIDVDFRALVIDESKAKGFLIFRLAECVSGIVISESLRDALRDIDGLNFVEPENWIG